MTRYKHLSDKELDCFLMIAFWPKKKESLNLSHIDLFNEFIVERLEKWELIEEWKENLEYFDVKGKISEDNIRQHKMAALKTFDEYKEFLK